ncbi:MAG: hypothetical protein OSJ27_08650 [Candidatus Gastranaerophilales bacterium]|nr:hypothetical protein [Candidatus Gastranaerophilales bacterium]
MIKELNTLSVLSNEDRKILLEFVAQEEARLREQNEIDRLEIYRAGKTFNVVGSEIMQTLRVEESGEVAPIRRIRFIDYSENDKQQTDKTLAQVLSFDDDSVIARVYFNDHPSKRKFKKSLLNRLRKKNLLHKGANFYIVTSEDEDGLHMDVEKIDNNVTPPNIRELQLKIAGAVNEEC